jgi:hypothetical protein
VPQAPPASGIEFERAWRRASSPHGRLALLRLVPADAYPALFKARAAAAGLQRRRSRASPLTCACAQVELPHALLGELLAALRHGWRDLAGGAGGGDAAAAAAAVLRGVAGAGRFALTARLLGSAAREHAAALLAELQAALPADAEQLAPLRRAYGV